MKKQRIVVVGNGMVGHKFIENLLQHEKAAEVEVLTFSEEPMLAYDRVGLSTYFTGATAEDLALTSEDYYRENQVNYVLGDKVIKIDRAKKVVITAKGAREPYDKLVLATGSTPFVPPIPGGDQEHCLVFRTLEDLTKIEASAEVSKIGVVVGGGLLGLEAANALHNLGLKTHVVEFAPQLMAVQLDGGGGHLLRSKIEDLGVTVHTGKNTKSIEAGESCRYRMVFADDTFLETDLILFSAGIRPQDELARSHDLKIGERGGIVIDNNCLTSDADVYAIGECALWQGRIYGLVAPGYQMAKVAALHLLDGMFDKTSDAAGFTGADMSTKLKLMGIDVASIGDAHGNTPGAKVYVYNNEPKGIYKRLVVTEDGKKLLGAVLVGDSESYGNLLQLKLNDMTLPENPEVLILPVLDGAAASMMGVEALPDTAQICSCLDVTKGGICSAVQDGAVDMGGIKLATEASTGCGGCAALVKQVMDSELEKLGFEVSDALCEHFPYSRKALADIIRIKEIRSFGALLKEYGQGYGCEICKPTVGSILASFWNDYILEDKHLGLQDSNDIFLGNIQKDGSYSVVPRIAGGEITPDKLIVLGEVAKEFDLYTKVTGGQRIDLFGAQLHELPLIWRKLVDAGFETGHAYGKSVRTVKSCVGSNWCRFGVGDAVGLAIEIEDRYKGLRSPHKLKFAVSGCTRECAEARSKDVGIIATEKGWNLYICGNGGMRPRHGELLATDLDKETLIRTIDRFLMFYVRTADRLQRTSVWLESLEGGLDYLRQVILEDSLGLADTLETEMMASLSQYQCEWKTTIDDPSKLKRFSQFVNSDLGDDNQAYVVERGQRRPATADERIKLKEIA